MTGDRGDAYIHVPDWILALRSGMFTLECSTMIAGLNLKGIAHTLERFAWCEHPFACDAVYWALRHDEHAQDRAVLFFVLETFVVEGPRTSRWHFEAVRLLELARKAM